ncbi:hypothetical protein F4803DRAFT_551817 [Xylaria telfairii]|nr:hypothetical protein F4803DRAFT_551817 [Xylaria telfairii]
MSPITECAGAIRATHLAPELTPRSCPQEASATPPCQGPIGDELPSYESIQFQMPPPSYSVRPPVGHSTPSPQSPPSSKGLWTKLVSLAKSLRGHAKTPNNERQETQRQIKQVEAELRLLRGLLATTKRADESDATWKLEREACTPAEIEQKLNERTKLGRVIDNTYLKLNTIAEVNFGSEWRYQATPRITVLETKLCSLKQLNKAQQDLSDIHRRVDDMRVVVACPRYSGMSRYKAVRILKNYLQDQSAATLKVSEVKKGIARLDTHLEEMLTAYLR